MEEAREVQCRCGERIFLVPSASVRCPRCGRRLFWKCACGALVERLNIRCPHCGRMRESRRSSAYPPLRLRTILLAGLVGAIVFTVLGHGLVKLFARLPLSEAGASIANVSVRGVNMLVQVFKGIWLIVTDAIGWIVGKIFAHPLIPIFAVAGFFLAAFIVARQQHFSLHRLKRHLRQRWQELWKKWS
ncbi:hypothetical protein B0813_001205 [Candidatus Fervidibacteria bacterium JGI MDM2 SSWTFF-3-K9]